MDPSSDETNGIECPFGIPRSDSDGNTWRRVEAKGRILDNFPSLCLSSRCISYIRVEHCQQWKGPLCCTALYDRAPDIRTSVRRFGIARDLAA